jgi:hypothetical protein
MDRDAWCDQFVDELPKLRPSVWSLCTPAHRQGYRPPFRSWAYAPVRQMPGVDWRGLCRRAACASASSRGRASPRSPCNDWRHSLPLHRVRNSVGSASQPRPKCALWLARLLRRRSMNSRDRASTYKGSTVTVRWKEIESKGSPGSVFVSSYMLTTKRGKQTDWRHFETLTFHTFDTAAAYALAAAHRFIDSQ